MSSFVKSPFQYDQLDSPKRDGDAEAPAPRVNNRPPFHGLSVPDEVTRDPSDAQIYVEFFENLAAAPGRERDIVIVFPNYLGFEEVRPGIRSHDNAGEDEIQKVEYRLQCTQRIYEHLFARQATHPRVVPFLGSTPTGYKLQRLHPGPLDRIRGLHAAHTSANLLALYQRWALQILSALVFFHSNGVILNAMTHEIFWLKEDLSLMVAGLASAACRELGISAGPWEATVFIGNPFVATDCFRREGPFTEADTGSPKKDIFDWATWVYVLMTDMSPIEHGLEDVETKTKAWASIERHKQIERREFHAWPMIEDKMLGPVVVRAWQGMYETASEVLEDARKVLAPTGTSLSMELCDEVTGIDWRSEFTLDPTDDDDYYRHIILRERQKV